MRYPDQSLIGDLSDEFLAKTSGSLAYVVPSTVDENQTTYSLLPLIINRPPVVVQPISKASTPIIQSAAMADATGQHMHLSSDGVVKVILGASMTFKIVAEQPPVLNVENGVLKMLNVSSSLTYVWRRDGELVDNIVDDILNASVVVKNNSIVFTNVQPTSAGTYTCDISNDVGTTTSEPIALEVLDLDFDSFFYSNLITNPYGLDGLNSWETNNNDLTTKVFSKTPTQDLTKPNRVDLFGYNMDCLHPRPYQLDAGVVRNYDLTSALLKTNASYFTRTRFKFERSGGNFLVRAYQDIDLSDIVDITKGSVYGIGGVRAIFCCYIGNAIAQYIPVQDIIDPSKRTDTTSYVMSRPRLSLQNFLNAGPALGTSDYVYVTVEEFDNETRLASSILQEDGSVKTQSEKIILYDPWNKRISNYFGKQYYSEDVYGIGELSKGDIRDATLFTADELYPEESSRYTYGQYAEFNKVVINKLNPSTTKIRIGLNFQTGDQRVFEQWKEGSDQSEEVYEVTSWETPYQKHKLTKPVGKYETTISQQLKNRSGNNTKTWPEILPAAQDPRGMVTGLNLTLLPLYAQQPGLTDYYTKTSLVRNNTPASKVTSGLVPGPDYSPV